MYIYIHESSHTFTEVTMLLNLRRMEANVSLKLILRSGSLGARLADPGELTKTLFLMVGLDLSQAEGDWIL